MYKQIISNENIQFLARDGNGELFGYRTKPVNYVDSQTYASDDNYAYFIDDQLDDFSPFKHIDYKSSPIAVEQVVDRL